MKLHTKLYLFFAGIVVLPLLVVTLVLGLVLGRLVTETYQARMQSALTAAQRIISQQELDLAEELRVSLKAIDPAPLASMDQAQRLATLAAIQQRSRFRAAAITGANGAITDQTGPLGSGPPMLAAAVHLNQAGGGQQQLVAYRLLDLTVLADVFTSQGLKWSLVANKTIIAGSLPEGASVSEEGGWSSPPEAPQEGGSFKIFDAVVNGEKVMSSLFTIPSGMSDRPLEVMASVPATATSSAFTRALVAGLGVTALVVILAAILGVLLARNITRPLRELTQAAAAGIEGDLGAKVNIKSRDEIGGLAASFGMMRESLRNYISELTTYQKQLQLALSYAGDILGSTTDRDQLIKTTAEAARLATGASGVWIHLLPQKQPPGHEMVEAGAPQSLFSGEKKELAHRLAESAVKGELYQGEAVDFGEENECVPYLLAHQGEKILGAMMALFPKGEAPPASKKRILNSLAKQAASALENVNFSQLQQFLAITDSLTGLLNYRFLREFLEREISKSRRYVHDLSLAVIDLDDFKLVNDVYGHRVGNEVLKAVADALGKRVRASDLVARFGGEEFIVVFPETSRADAWRVAEELRSSIANVSLPAYPDLTVTASIGVAALSEKVTDEKSLIEMADQALYQAKRTGKNRSVEAG